MPTLNSGGADGADTLFGKMAKKAGHKVRHFSFEKHDRHDSDIDPKDIITLSDFSLKMADEPLKRANLSLNRSFPSKNPHTNNLLRRNFWQIQNTQCVYAVAALAPDRKYVMGGTAWAIQMAIDRGIHPVYLFDLDSSQWFEWVDKKWSCDHHYMAISMPVCFETYTGIGSRKLTEAGEKAIKWLYKDLA